MTPEDLEQIPGIDAGLVERIQDAVLSYYGQFEPAEEAPPPGEDGVMLPIETVDAEADSDAQAIVMSKDDPDAYGGWSGQAESSGEAEDIAESILGEAEEEAPPQAEGDTIYEPEKGAIPATGTEEERS